MSDTLYIGDFLQPVNSFMLSEDEGYKDGQIGKKILVYEDEEMPDLKQADLILLGCNEIRGGSLLHPGEPASDVIRRQFYSLYQWHSDVNLVDIGNISLGAG